MQVSSPSSSSIPPILKALPDPPIVEKSCPRRVRLQIDLLLLAIEAIDLTGSEAFLRTTKELELQDIIQTRVVLWQLRSTNPLRRNSQRRPLTLLEAKALVMIACHLSKRLTVVLLQLIRSHQQHQEQELPLNQFPRLAFYLSRFRTHFRARMNPNRAGVLVYDTEEKMNQLAIDYLRKLLFCTGTAGPQRVWSSLFDGEVA
ncbi:MAG: DUF3038 domain-containing protein [Leptolyngbyaceae bacterium]|nr:DUF3038 domain-containing protein [Leptolyngbyaceae bacterium]